MSSWFVVFSLLHKIVFGFLAVGLSLSVKLKWEYWTCINKLDAGGNTAKPAENTEQGRYMGGGTICIHTYIDRHLCIYIFYLCVCMYVSCLFEHKFVITRAASVTQVDSKLRFCLRGCYQRRLHARVSRFDTCGWPTCVEGARTRQRRLNRNYKMKNTRKRREHNWQCKVPGIHLGSAPAKDVQGRSAR